MSLDLSELLARILVFLQEMEIFVLIICNICFFLTFFDLFRIKKQRIANINQIKEDKNANNTTNIIKFLRSFTITSFFCFLFVDGIFTALYYPSSFYLFNFLNQFFSSPLVISFLIQLFGYLGVYIFFSKAKEILAREVLVKRTLTRLQKLFLCIIGLLVINFIFFLGTLILDVFIEAEFLLILQNINISLFLIVGGLIFFYIFGRYFIDLNYKSIQQPFPDSNMFLISNSIVPKFYKGFMVLKIQGIRTNEIFEINFKILKFVKEIALEVRFERNSSEIYMWIFSDDSKKRNIYAKLRSFAEEFNTLFPSAEARILLKEEVINLLNCGENSYILKAKKQTGLDFLNNSVVNNKLDELLHTLTSFSQDGLAGSIIFKFKIQNQPKTVLKKKNISVHYSGNQNRGTEKYQELDSYGIDLQKRLDFETNVYDRGFTSGLFLFDLHILLNNTNKLTDDFYREKTFLKVQEFVFKIYNITIKPLNFIETIFLNKNRVKFRQTLSQKAFLISGDLLRNLLRFPTTPHLDLKIERDYRLSFPEPCQSEQKPINLGKLVEHKNQRDWSFPLSELARSMIILGIPGMGKTNFILNLLNELKKFEIPYLVFDIKQDYLDIFDDTTLILRPGANFFINMFDSKDRDPGTHAAFLFNLILSMFSSEDFSPAVQELLLDTLERTCANKNLCNLEGFWKNLDFVSEKIPARNRNEVKAALKVRLSTFFRGSMGYFLRDNPCDIYSIFDNKAIIDLNYFQNVLGASFDQLHFLTKLILQFLTYKNLSRVQTVGEGLTHVCVIDDATSFLKESEKGETSFLKILIQLCRKMQQGLIISNQSPEGLDIEVIEYPNTLVCFRHADRMGISRNSLGFASNQKILNELEPFNAIVKSNQSTTPFKIQTVHFLQDKKYSPHEMEKITSYNLTKINKAFDSNHQIEKSFCDPIIPREIYFSNSSVDIQKGLLEIQGIKEEIGSENYLSKRSTNLIQLFKELLQDQSLKEILKENIEKSGFLTVKQIEKLVNALSNTKIEAFRNSKKTNRIRGLLKVLLMQDSSFCRKIMTINNKSYMIITNSKYSHIYDACSKFFQQVSKLGREGDAVFYNRRIFLNEIEQLIEI